MAPTVPSLRPSLARSPDVSGGDAAPSAVYELLLLLLLLDGSSICRATSSSRPSAVALHPRSGLVSICHSGLCHAATSASCSGCQRLLRYGRIEATPPPAAAAQASRRGSASSVQRRQQRRPRRKQLDVEVYVCLLADCMRSIARRSWSQRRIL